MKTAKGYLVAAALCILASAVAATGCSCNESNGGWDANQDGQDTWPDNWPEVWPDWLDIPDGMEGCDPSIRWW